MKVYTYNDKVLVNSANDKWLKAHDMLPPLTIRVKLKDGASLSINGATCTQVSTSPNIWDVCTATGSKLNNWYSLFQGNTNLLEVLDANTKGTGSINDLIGTSSMFKNCTALTSVPLFDTSSVNNMNSMFYKCSSLTSVPLFNTSSVNDMGNMFIYCSSLASVPLFDTSSVNNMNSMFESCSSLTSVPLFNTSSVSGMGGMFKSCSSLTSIPLFNTSRVTNMEMTFASCINVESGALALYQQVSTQTYVPEQHDGTFYNCGSNTTTGAAELAQIPSSWKS